MKRTTTLIIATITFLGGLAAVSAAPCTVTGLQCGGLFFTGPFIFDINVSDPVDPATVDASDFTVNGIPASTFSLSNNNTSIGFVFPTSPARQGQNTMHIAAGAFNCLSGPVLEFTCEFLYRPFAGRPTPHPRPTPRL